MIDRLATLWQWRLRGSGKGYYSHILAHQWRLVVLKVGVVGGTQDNTFISKIGAHSCIGFCDPSSPHSSTGCILYWCAVLAQ